LAQAFVKNILATYIGRQTDCHGDILNPPLPGLMRRENNSVMSSTKNEAVVNIDGELSVTGRREITSKSLNLFSDAPLPKAHDFLEQSCTAAEGLRNSRFHCLYF
jgi:hypothetical protein